jgi:NADH:ubiquinone oxidoreductase subunit D
MEFYERVSGARMHAAFYRPNEVNLTSVSKFLVEDMVEFSNTCLTTLNEMHNVLTYNKIWKQRLVNIGVYSYKTCLDYALTGVMARSAGIKRDLRVSKNETYANYYYLNFRVFTGQNGDSYDRYLIRMYEMGESLNIINQIIFKLLGNKKKINIKPLYLLKQINMNQYNNSLTKHEYVSMEKLIKHFKY